MPDPQILRNGSVGRRGAAQPKESEKECRMPRSCRGAVWEEERVLVSRSKEPQGASREPDSQILQGCSVGRRGAGELEQRASRSQQSAGFPDPAKEGCMGRRGAVSSWGNRHSGRSRVPDSQILCKSKVWGGMGRDGFVIELSKPTRAMRATELGAGSEHAQVGEGVAHWPPASCAQPARAFPYYVIATLFAMYTSHPAACSITSNYK